MKNSEKSSKDNSMQLVFLTHEEMRELQKRIFYCYIIKKTLGENQGVA